MRVLLRLLRSLPPRRPARAAVAIVAVAVSAAALVGDGVPGGAPIVEASPERFIPAQVAPGPKAAPAQVAPGAQAAPTQVAAGAQDAPDQFAPRQSAQTTIAAWEPKYTSFLTLSDTDDMVALELAGDTLWLATERVVTHFRSGVWAANELVSDSGYVFAIAAAPGGQRPWAFGFEGSAWRRNGDTWVPVASGTVADLYDTVALDEDHVWAVGYDYQAGRGVVVRSVSGGLEATTRSWLEGRQLLAIAASADGELWVGGCDGDHWPFLMRDRYAGAWEPVQPPDVQGCVEHISFAPDGTGLAAVDSELLWYDGNAWSPFGQPPPDGFAWVRVSAETRTTATDSESGPPNGWAIAGEPTWRGYINGQAPYSFDGSTWRQAKVDYRGYDALFRPGEQSEPQAFLDLVGDGARSLSISRSGGPAILERQAALMSLEDATARISHPLLLPLFSASPAAIAHAGADVWAAQLYGAAPFIRHRDGDWSVAPGSVFDGGDRFHVVGIDFSSATTGWATGWITDTATSHAAAWQWDGVAWHDRPAPQQARAGATLRALPDGGAWALEPNGQLVAFDGRRWSPVPGAPRFGPSTNQPRPQYTSQRAPFDAAPSRDYGQVAWAADLEQIYLYTGAFVPVQLIPRGQVLDLQLVDVGSGWSIGRDAGAGAAGRSMGVLMALRDRRWAEVDLAPALRRIAADGSFGQRVDFRQIEWHLMSPVDAEEVWLYGTAPLGAGRETSFLAQVRVFGNPTGSARVTIEAFPRCSANALSAVPARGGTDVWLMSRSACGPYKGAVSTFGPVSMLSVRTVQDTQYLPAVARRPR